ncbi:hypothetical protein QTP88_003704 [Uroleucon formosanum]
MIPHFIEVLTTIRYISPPLNNSSVVFPEKTPFDFSDLQHSCDLCVNYAKQQQQLDQSFLFIYYKAYVTADHSNFGNLNVPPNEFFNYINQLDDVFIINFPLLTVEPNVGSKLKNFFDNIPFDHPCKNFDIEFLKKLYIRIWSKNFSFH